MKTFRVTFLLKDGTLAQHDIVSTSEELAFFTCLLMHPTYIFRLKRRPKI